MEFYETNGALQIHNNVVIVVGVDAALEQNTVVAQLVKSGCHAVSLIGVAARTVATAGQHNNGALCLTRIFQQIRNNKGNKVRIIV